MSRARDLADGTFSGDLTIPDKVVHTDDTNTAIRFPAADTVTVETAGSERVRVDASGNVGIGVSSPAYKLDVSLANNEFILAREASGNITNGFRISGPANENKAVFSANSATGEVNLGAINTNYFLTFSTNGANERMRIDSSGALLINRTANASTFHYSAISYNANAGHRGLAIQATVQDIGTAITFYNASGTVCGSISQGTSSTSYNTSSDYRLKENVVPLAGAADRLAQIPVHRFNFIADPDRTVDGFLAHEVQEFVPECVTGTKDQVETVEVTDEDGNVTTETRPVYQGIDQSKLVPLLTAALQEALADIATLKAEVAALKGSA